MVSFAEFDADLAGLQEEKTEGCCACCRKSKKTKDVALKNKKMSLAIAEQALQSVSESLPEVKEFIDPKFLPLTFVPDFIIEEIQEDSFRSLPYVLTSEAVLLVADVSGFTKLCESYCKQGVSGIEQLAAVLNGFMSTLTAMLISGGGDILKFAGDAFLVQWVENGDTGGMKTAAHKAYECAVALQTHECLRTKNLDGTLRVKVGIAVGEITTWVLGSPSEFLLFVVAGPTVPRVQQAEGLCSAGEIVITEKVYNMLDELHFDTYRTTQLEGGFFKILDYGTPEAEREPRPDRIRLFEKCRHQHITMAKVFLIPSLRGLKSMNELEYVSELTMVTILFIALLNIKVAEPEVLDLSFDIILAAVKERGGVLNKMILFDKGCTFLVAFGLPGLKHSNDAARSILCANTVVEKLAAINILVSVGITSGTCFCGIVGHPQRQEFTVIGSHVNMAARIMVFYNDEPVAMDITTYHLSRDELGHDSFVELPTRRMKGIDSPGIIYAYRKSYTEKHRSVATFDMAEDSDIHGSEREKEKIRRCMAELRDEGGRAAARKKTLLPVLVVKGNDASGKGYLLFYTVDAAVAAGYQIAVCCAIPSLCSEPFSVISRLLQRMLGITMNESSCDRENIILASLPEPDWNTLYVLNHFFHVHFPVLDTPPSDPYLRHGQFKKLAKEIVHQFCLTEYTLIAVNNAVWMDDASWKFLRELAEDHELKVVVAVGLGLTFKEEKPATTALILKAYLHVNAEDLEEDCFAPLLCWFLGVKAVHISLFVYLREMTKGKTTLLKEIALSPSCAPFIQLVPLDSIDESRLHKEFYVDTVQSLKDKQPMACDVNPETNIKHARLPTNINDTVKDSLNNLSIQDRLLLKRAAVLGEDFDLHTLEAVSHGVTREEVLQSIHSLLRNNIFTSVCSLENRIDASEAKKLVPTVNLRPSNVCLCFDVYLRADATMASVARWPIGPYHRLNFRTAEFRSGMLANMTKEQIYSMHMEVADNLESNGPECSACKGKRVESMDLRTTVAKVIRSYAVESKLCSCLQRRPALYSEISNLYASMGMIFLPAYFKKKAAQAAINVRYPVQALEYIRYAEDMIPKELGNIEIHQEESYFDPVVLEVSLTKKKSMAFLLLKDTYSAASHAFKAIEKLGLNSLCFHGAYKPKEFKKVLSKMQLLYAETVTQLIPKLAEAYMQTHYYELARHILDMEYEALKLYPLDFLQVLTHMTRSYRCQYWIDDWEKLHELENNIFRLCYDKLRKFDVLIDLTEIDGIGAAYTVIVETNLSLARFSRAKSTATEAIKILQLITETRTLVVMKILLFRVCYHLKKFDYCFRLLKELESSAAFLDRRKFQTYTTCGLMLLMTEDSNGIRKKKSNPEKWNMYARQWTMASSKILSKETALYACACVATWCLYSKEHFAWIEGDSIYHTCLEIAANINKNFDKRYCNYWIMTADVMLAQLWTRKVKEGLVDDIPSLKAELLRLKKVAKSHYPLYTKDVKNLMQELEKISKKERIK